MPDDEQVPPEESDRPREENHPRIRALVGLGAELVGGAAGGALGFLLAGPAGAVAAGAGGVAITRSLVAAGEEVCDRILSAREQARVGAALAVAAIRTQERIQAGDKVRDDGFVADGTNRPPIEEVTEGLLLAAQRAYDEKKVPYIGRLSANLNFRPDMDVRSASVLVRLAGDLSYQQLCLLRLAYENQAGTPLSGGKYKDCFKSTAHAALLTDLLELERAGFLNMGGSAVLGMTDIDPPQARLQAFGVHLYELMELHRIPVEDLEPLRRELNAPDAVYLTSASTSSGISASYFGTSPSLSGHGEGKVSIRGATRDNADKKT
jgi:hypothetical protein